MVALNAVCPYFTMFPLEFPLRVLSRTAGSKVRVLDPFCGRGTTNMAARVLGLPTMGIDSHPLAVALTKAKLVSTNPKAIMDSLERILGNSASDDDVPRGDFWELAFEETTLASIAKLRGAFRRDCRSSSRIALRAIVLGALHGPLTKGDPSYFSNQCPRTYAPKPRYAIKYWDKNGLKPQRVDVRKVVARRADRFYSEDLRDVESQVLLGDSRDKSVFQEQITGQNVDWIVTSPPYYGLTTYRPDQWLRLWFLGGKESVDYSQSNQLTHDSPETFARQLSQVWRNCSSVCRPGARMVIRFGRIPVRSVDPVKLLRESLSGTDWRIQTRHAAGSAAMGKRQASHFGVISKSHQEFDLWAVKT